MIAAVVVGVGGAVAAAAIVLAGGVLAVAVVVAERRARAGNAAISHGDVNWLASKQKYPLWPVRNCLIFRRPHDHHVAIAHERIVLIIIIITIIIVVSVAGPAALSVGVIQLSTAMGETQSASQLRLVDVILVGLDGVDAR